MTFDQLRQFAAQHGVSVARAGRRGYEVLREDEPGDVWDIWIAKTLPEALAAVFECAPGAVDATDLRKTP